MTDTYVISWLARARQVAPPANRLSADQNRSVLLLLEAGGKDNYAWIHIPVGYLYCIGNPRTDWCFTRGRAAERSFVWLSARQGAGGCSSINGMIYMRGQGPRLRSVASGRMRRLGLDDVLPLFKKFEDYFAG